MTSLPQISFTAPSYRGPEQLLLTGILPGGPPTDGLFFAILPDLAAADSVARLASRLRTKHGLGGNPLATERFHVTLHHFGNYHGLRHDFVEMACEAAVKVIAQPFAVAFDRAMSFRRNFDDRPLVLRGDSHLATLKKFRQDLGGMLTMTGLGRKIAKSFTPHVTLLYDPQTVAEQPVEPVAWTVTEFVLVHSLLGQTQHKILGRWPLSG